LIFQGKMGDSLANFQLMLDNEIYKNQISIERNTSLVMENTGVSDRAMSLFWKIAINH